LVFSTFFSSSMIGGISVSGSTDVSSTSTFLSTLVSTSFSLVDSSSPSALSFR
jgi:hypothetical protein